ncbi:glycosylphosphatidylinositol anchor attachment 1 protein-like [Dendroctonus ponderosae]|uniref:GPI-anchor transamidase component GPAA1 n=1 Tax=Dendroctonus ponderosae TaxID=77166 RepID=U4UZG3_DENPD|nr:glycosylphosphatidylinositol anchor attachment 1 protein [Dendroctonus ponderosae]XP_048518174.1 glycosylphosphatidylinositol anchor attachment 1 protein-like [Dendroctonus ponderosae]ERL95801.1 hypothetical protein D910_00329 [Dendroctonus ponderosae]ERL96220.1 hypothetical protein D910_01479 [Dendroctonus ponderosae]KAH1006521.1 hypothetical protein HUJ05_007249 [Dendroctonus ponderosae]KAH1006537.1 hypothetical protein HUJ05_007262 [Dendroctonus ponderosae]
MGLLTDPSSGHGKLTKILLRFYVPLCVLLYIAGVLWFAALASPLVNASTYFSENALLPGLVKSTFREDKAALQYFQELEDEAGKYGDSIPYPWLLAKFRQIGLDSYTHNFTLHSPLNPNETFQGKNVYGILRAPRASSTEALVLTAPYRPPSSVHSTTLPSIAIQLAFAKFAVREKYWAKDIIFLITDHEQLGIQAWLEAYHGVSCGSENTLDHGQLRGRAGAIQAAINLELHSVRIGHVDLKIEGLNGQLPNLDLFNLAARICAKEGIFYTFKERTATFSKSPYKEWWHYFKNMMSMVATQATGIPNGNHGLFLRFGIQALTVEGFQETKGGSRVGLLSMGRVIEGVFRSMNNLLERFHQSFFFYILPSSDRYISIGLYMPAVCMLGAALIIRACAKWCQIQENQQAWKGRYHKTSYREAIVLFLILHCIGALFITLPQSVKFLSKFWALEITNTILIALIGNSLAFLSVPYMFGELRNCPQSLNLLCIFSLLELGTTIICLSMNNISLGIICGAIIVPFALIIDVTSSKGYGLLQKTLWLLVHPLVVLLGMVFIITCTMFSQDRAKDIVFRTIFAYRDAVLFSIVDSMIYGNWLYSVIGAIFIPNWLCFWVVAFGNSADISSPSKSKKTD